MGLSIIAMAKVIERYFCGLANLQDKIQILFDEIQHKILAKSIMNANEFKSLQIINSLQIIKSALGVLNLSTI